MFRKPKICIPFSVLDHTASAVPHLILLPVLLLRRFFKRLSRPELWNKREFQEALAYGVVRVQIVFYSAKVTQRFLFQQAEGRTEIVRFQQIDVQRDAVH